MSLLLFTHLPLLMPPHIFGHVRPKVSMNESLTSPSAPKLRGFFKISSIITLKSESWWILTHFSRPVFFKKNFNWKNINFYKIQWKFFEKNWKSIFTFTSLVHISICMSVKSLNFKFAVSSFIVFKAWLHFENASSIEILNHKN